MMRVGRHAFAHRGLWQRGGAPENSLAAFHGARTVGMGIELDVRRLGDGTLVVHHDDDLDRMFGRPGAIAALTLDDWRGLRLPDGSAPPTLEEALAAVGDAPALIEVKAEGDPESLADAAASALAGAPETVAAMSFDAAIVRRLRARLDSRPVGLLIEPEPFIGEAGVRAQAALGQEIGADFLAVHLTGLATASAAATGLELATWTVADPALLGHARRYGAAPIFEGFAAGLARAAIASAAD